MKNKLRYHAYSVPILGWCLRNTVGRRSRSHAVLLKTSNEIYGADYCKIQLTAWALHYHSIKQVHRAKFIVKDWEGKLAVSITVPSKKSLAKDKEA
jgi:hypothetical protein